MKIKMMFVMLLLSVVTKGIAQQNYNRKLIIQPGPVEGKDAMIFNKIGESNLNYGNYPYVIGQTWTWGGPSNEYTMRTLIDFDLSMIPPNADIQSAYLTLYGISESPGHSVVSSAYSSDFEFFLLDGSWDENTVTWQSQPTNRSLNGAFGESGPTEVDQDYTFWVWDYVNQKKNRTNSPTGLLVKVSSETRYRRVMFYSSDHSDPSKRPKLVVYYKVPGVPCPAPVTIQETICQGKAYTLNGISYSTSGTYKDTLQTREGCDSIVTLVLTVAPPDTLKESASICEGESFSFQNSTFQETGIYNIMVSDNNGCDVVHQLDLVKQALPVKPLITFSNALLYTEDNYQEYEWTWNDQVVENANSPDFSPVLEGEYKIVVKNEAGCVNTSDGFLYATTGTKELESSRLKIFPNPVEDKLIVEVPSEWSGVEVSIVTMTGVEIHRSKISTSEHQLFLEAIQPGVYFVKIYSGTIEKAVRSFVKNK